MGSNIRISNSDLDPIPCPLGGPTYVFFTKDGDIRYGTCFLAHSISSYPRAKALEAAGCPAPGQGILYTGILRPCRYSNGGPQPSPTPSQYKKAEEERRTRIFTILGLLFVFGLVIGAFLSNLNKFPSPTSTALAPIPLPAITSAPRPTSTPDIHIAPVSPSGFTNTPAPLDTINPTNATDVASKISNCPRPEDCITSPRTQSRICGDVRISGTATDPDFEYYKFEIQPKGAADWAFLSRFDTPVSNGILWENWNTRAIQPGEYLIRLRVVKNDGNYTQPDAQVDLFICM